LIAEIKDEMKTIQKLDKYLSNDIIQLMDRMVDSKVILLNKVLGLKEESEFYGTILDWFIYENDFGDSLLTCKEDDEDYYINTPEDLWKEIKGE